MPKPYLTARTAERMSGAAYEYEALAKRFREAGFESEANSLKSISSTLGHIGRGLAEKFSR